MKIPVVTPHASLYNAHMKHAEYMTDADKAKLAQIAATVSEARAARQRVLTRIRQRAYRAAARNG